MYDVLLAVDGDEDRALAQAKTVADLPHANDSVHARLLHVFGENPTGASVTRVAAVRRAEEYLEERGVSVTLEEESGDPTVAVVEAAEALDVDLICVAGRKRTPTGKVLFGSVTQGVILETDRPVLVCDTDWGPE